MLKKQSSAMDIFYPLRLISVALYTSSLLLISPLWALLCLTKSWRGATFPHIRIQIAHKVAVFSDYMGLCPFYKFIRRTYAMVDIVVQSKKAGGVGKAVEFGGVPCDLITAHDSSTSATIVLHGGGFIYGSTKNIQGLSQAVTDRFNCDVIAVKYSLAPEHLFPTSLREVVNVLIAVTEKYDKVTVIGVSAGATLAVSAVLYLQDHYPKSITLDSLVLVGGPYSANCSTKSYCDYGAGPKLTKTMVCQYLSLYFTGSLKLYKQFMSGAYANADRAQYKGTFSLDQKEYDEDVIYCKYALPLSAASYRSFPPTLLLVSEFDVLKDDTLSLERRLRNDRVATKLHVLPGPHIHLAGSVSSNTTVRQVVEIIQSFHSRE